MTAASANNFDALLSAVLDGSATPDQIAQLDTLIDSDDALLEQYHRLMTVHAMFAWREQFGAKSRITPGAPGTPVATATPRSAEGVPIYRKGHEPKPTRIRPVYYAITAIAAALLAACGLAVYLLAFNTPTTPQPDPVTPNQPGPAVATLIEVSGGGDLRTPHGYPAEGEDFSAGEYTLTTGSAEFMLTNAVNVKLRGSTRMVMRDDMNVALPLGSAEFIVPANARGFTVHLPGKSRVIDLGTEFSVETEAEGQVRVSVITGQVEWLAAGRDPTPVLITEGRTARIVDGTISFSSDVELAVENAGFEDDAPGTEGASGWTIVAGGEATEFWTSDGSGISHSDPDTGHGGSPGFLTANRLATTPDTSTNPSTSTASQDIDVSAWSADIDTGRLTVDVSFFYNIGDRVDRASATIEFFNGAGDSLGNVSTRNLDNTAADAWVAASIGDGAVAVPINTRRFTITLNASRTSGTATNVSFDSIKVTLRGVSDPQQPATEVTPHAHTSEPADYSSGATEADVPSSEIPSTR